MLVLTRKQQQQIKIGDQITVTILKVKGRTVRVGIEAPREMRVVRAELPPETGASQTEGETSDAEAPASESVMERSTATATRLPQRRIYRRTGSPPLRLAMATASASLAK